MMGALTEQLLSVAEQLLRITRARAELLNDYHRESGVSAGSERGFSAEERRSG
jgi:hypothetical protein